MNLTDQRVVKTRKQLKAAFVDLVNENGYDSITVQDITSRSGVGYRTFFRHYKDTRDLMEDALAEFVTAVHNELLPADTPEMTRQNIITMFRYIEKHHDLFRAFYSTPYYTDFNMPLHKWGSRLGSLLFETLDLEIPLEIVLTHFLHSMLSIQRWWVESGMQIPAETMGGYTYSLILHPLVNQQ